MIGFALFAALLAGLALWFMLPPLLRSHSRVAPQDDDEAASNLSVLREQLAQADAELASGGIDAAQHRLARSELERRVLEEEVAAGNSIADRRPAAKTAWTLVVVLPVFAVATYVWLGQPAAISGSNSAQRTAGSGGPQDRPAAGPSQQEVEAMVEKLAQRMQAEPGDPKGWAMLARSYAALQRFPEAVSAYAKAVALMPDDAPLLADYADALAVTQGQSAAGEPTRLIERALKADPNNLKALALAGSAAMERQEFATAVGYWKQALQKVPPGSELANAIEGSMNEAQEAAKAAPASALALPASETKVAQAPQAPQVAPAAPLAPKVPAPPAVAAATASAGKVSGRVTLAPALAARVQPGDTVFIFARAAEGPRMPLAILRQKASELPITFTLDDSTAMSPEMKLSKFANVVVSARISRSGDAMPRSGDLQGQSGPVKVGSAGLEIVIDSVQP